MKEKKGYINDVVICQDNNLELNYIHKISKYKELQKKLRNNREIIYVEIIPVIVSINRLIHKESARRLKSLKLQLNFTKNPMNNNNKKYERLNVLRIQFWQHIRRRTI